MKNIGLGFFILIYALFAPLCFASGIFSDAVVEKTEASSISHQHSNHTVTSSTNCHEVTDSCGSEGIAAVLGHAAMYDSITSIELVSLGMVLFFILALFLYCQRLFRQVINYRQLTWYRYKIKARSFFLRQDFLAWTSFHTRSPNLLFVLA